MIERNSQKSLENDAPSANQVALFCSPAAFVGRLQIQVYFSGQKFASVTRFEQKVTLAA